jgi:hypothetical protein
MCLRSPPALETGVNHMTRMKITGAVATLLCLGMTVPVYAQERGEQGGQPGEKKPPAQQQRAQPRQQQDAQPPQEQRQQHAQQPQRAQSPQQGRAQQQPSQQRAQSPQRGRSPQQPSQQRAQSPPQQSRSQPQRSPEQARAWQQQKGWTQKGGWQGRGSWTQNRAQHWESDHRTWAQRGGYGGYYIPQNRFSIYFGSRHVFRIRTRPAIYMGYPRFAYGGFSFLLVDPWPEYWPENWYNTDDVYIDYDDGYYLYNRRYPQIRLAITIVM